MKRVRRFAGSEKGLELIVLTGVLLGTLLFPRPKRRLSHSDSQFPIDLDSDGELRVPMSQLVNNPSTSDSGDQSLQSLPHRELHRSDRRLLTRNDVLAILFLIFFVTTIAFFQITGNVCVVVSMIGMLFVGLLLFASTNPRMNRYKWKK